MSKQGKPVPSAAGVAAAAAPLQTSQASTATVTATASTVWAGRLWPGASGTDGAHLIVTASHNATTVQQPCSPPPDVLEVSAFAGSQCYRGSIRRADPADPVADVPPTEWATLVSEELPDAHMRPSRDGTPMSNCGERDGPEPLTLAVSTVWGAEHGEDLSVRVDIASARLQRVLTSHEGDDTDPTKEAGDAAPFLEDCMQALCGGRAKLLELQTRCGAIQAEVEELRVAQKVLQRAEEQRGAKVMEACVRALNSSKQLQEVE